MSIQKIITTPNPVLVGTAKEVKKFDSKLKNLLKDMEDTLRSTVDPVGVGLAAPQIGVALRIFQMKPTEKSAVSSYINPVIVAISEEDSQEVRHEGKVEQEKGSNKLLEGCLSIPDIWGNVTRKKELTLTWQDVNGKSYTKLFKGFPAIIVQHEVDHLNGILFTKHVMTSLHVL